MMSARVKREGGCGGRGSRVREIWGSGVVWGQGVPRHDDNDEDGGTYPTPPWLTDSRSLNIYLTILLTILALLKAVLPSPFTQLVSPRSPLQCTHILQTNVCHTETQKDSQTTRTQTFISTKSNTVHDTQFNIRAGFKCFRITSWITERRLQK